MFITTTGMRLPVAVVVGGGGGGGVTVIQEIIVVDCTHQSRTNYYTSCMKTR